MSALEKYKYFARIGNGWILYSFVVLVRYLEKPLDFQVQFSWREWRKIRFCIVSHIFLNRETKTKKSPLFRHNHHRNLMVGWFFRRYRYLYHAPHNLNSTTILSLITISGFMVYENFCPEIVRYPFFSYRHHLWTRTYQRVVKSNANLDITMIC